VEIERPVFSGTAACRPCSARALALPAAGLVIGLPLNLLGMGLWPHRIWLIATLPVLMGLSVDIFMRLRRGDVGLDVVAAMHE
jgi:hypothetical protein